MRVDRKSIFSYILPTKNVLYILHVEGEIILFNSKYSRFILSIFHFYSEVFENYTDINVFSSFEDRELFPSPSENSIFLREPSEPKKIFLINLSWIRGRRYVFQKFAAAHLKISHWRSRHKFQPPKKTKVFVRNYGKISEVRYCCRRGLWHGALWMETIMNEWQYYGLIH